MKRLTDINMNTKDFWDTQYNPNREYGYKEKNLMYLKYDKALELVRNGMKVLDMACGFAIMAEKVKNAFPKCDVWAFDMSDIIDRLKEQHPNITFVKSEIGKEDIPGNFDIIFALDVLEHLDDPYIVFTDAYKHLKKGGILLVNTPDGDCKPYAASPEHLWLLDHEDLDGFFEKSGFVDVDYPYIPGKEGVLFIQAFGVKK